MHEEQSGLDKKMVSAEQMGNFFIWKVESKEMENENAYISARAVFTKRTYVGWDCTGDVPGRSGTWNYYNL